MQLRPYQTASVDALLAYWQAENGSALIDLPTGTGKSVVIAQIIKLVAEHPGAKIVIATHVRELVQQNHDEFVGMFPEFRAVTGINSASLKRRDVDTQITFCSIQSVYKQATAFTAIDVILVDEAHLMPRNDQTMYRKFLSDALVCNPDCRLVGLTATPYRLDSGRLDEGDGKVFDKVVYDYNVGTAIEEGYLSPVTTRCTKTHFDLSSVSIRGGEFVAGELERAVDKPDVNKSAVAEIIEQGETRKSWIVFCSGVEHANHIAELIREAGYSVGVILGDTPSAERANLIAEFKAGNLRCLCGVSVLTTGFNAPSVDLIAMLRPTQSAGLYVQVIGRGTRLAPGKTDCLVLDFAQNIERFGPIDAIRVKKKGGKGEGDAPVKTCPECEIYVHAAVRNCPCCGHEFPKPQPKIIETFSRAAILSKQAKTVIGSVPQWMPVTSVRFSRHQKPGAPDSLLVTYVCGLEVVRSWICLEHHGFPQTKAQGWWRKLANMNVPKTVTEALERQHEVRTDIEISVRQNGRFTEVVGERFVRGVLPGSDMVGVLAATG